MLLRYLTAIHLAAILLAPWALPNCRATEATSSTVGSVSYHRQIEPILRARCQGCHQPAKSYGGYVLTSHQRLLESGESGEAAIVPGRPEESELVRQITVSEGMAAMPKQAPPLPTAEVELIRQWILEGAQDDSPAAGLTVDAQHPPVYVRPPLIASLAFAPNGQWLAVSGFHEVILVDAQENRTVHRLVGLSDAFSRSAFRPTRRAWRSRAARPAASARCSCGVSRRASCC